MFTWRTNVGQAAFKKQNKEKVKKKKLFSNVSITERFDFTKQRKKIKSFFSCLVVGSGD